jgi:hypothetical protein
VGAPPAPPTLTLAEKMNSTTHLLLDRGHRVIGALVGQPRDAHGWRAVHDDALGALRSAARRLGFTEKEEMGGRRGPFPTIAHGLSYGGGQKVREHQCPPPLCTDGWLPPSRSLAFSGIAQGGRLF